MKKLVAALMLSMLCACSLIDTVASGDYRVVAVAQIATHKQIDGDAEYAATLIDVAEEIRESVIDFGSVSLSDVGVIARRQAAKVTDKGDQVAWFLVIQMIEQELAKQFGESDSALDEAQLVALDVIYSAVVSAASEYVE